MKITETFSIAPVDNLSSAHLRMSLDTSGKCISLTAEVDNSEQLDICVGMDEPAE